VSGDSVLSAYLVQSLLVELNRFNLESRASRGKASREFIQARLQEAKADLLGAERSLALFRAANLRIGNSPDLQTEQARLEREVMFKVELYRLLVQQYELARIEEERDTATFTVIEKAVPPVRKHRPLTLVNMAIALLASLSIQIGLPYLRSVGVFRLKNSQESAR
jgi:uncharacterized protein involved in exopolysaccharide biosynthesis